MQADDPERLVWELDRNRGLRFDHCERIANRVRARVDDLPSAEVGCGPRAGRVADRRDREVRQSVQLLRERVQEIEAAQSGLDVGHRCAERAAEDRAVQSRHRVAVHEHSDPRPPSRNRRRSGR